MSYLRRTGAIPVRELSSELTSANAPLNEEDLVDLVWRLVDDGKVSVEDMPPKARSFLSYLKLWERNLWFYLSIGISLITMEVIFNSPQGLPFAAMRWALGAIFLLIVPGYAAVQLIFSAREEGEMERLALSIGLSLALVQSMGLLLSYTPWGIGLNSLVYSLTALTIGLASIALVKQFRASKALEGGQSSSSTLSSTLT